MKNGYKFIEVTIGGRRYTLDKERVLQAANELKEAGDLGKVDKYFLTVADVNFPPSRLLAKALGIMLIEVNGQVAFRALTELGFRVLQREKR